MKTEDIKIVIDDQLNENDPSDIIAQSPTKNANTGGQASRVTDKN